MAAVITVLLLTFICLRPLREYRNGPEGTFCSYRSSTPLHVVPGPFPTSLSPKPLRRFPPKLILHDRQNSRPTSSKRIFFWGGTLLQGSTIFSKFSKGQNIYWGLPATTFSLEFFSIVKSSLNSNNFQRQTMK